MTTRNGHSSRHENNSPPDVTWQAFRYVAGEMSTAEREEFESSLADDADRCTAVAQAVQTCAAVCVVESESAVQSRVALTGESWANRRRQRVAAWVVVTAVAACLLLLFGPGMPDGSKSPPVRTTVAARAVDEQTAVQLVAYWNRSITAVAAETGSVLPESEYEPTSPAEEVEDSFGWMLAAVSEDRDEAPANDKTWEN